MGLLVRDLGQARRPAPPSDPKPHVFSVLCRSGRERPTVAVAVAELIPSSTSAPAGDGDSRPPPRESAAVALPSVKDVSLTGKQMCRSTVPGRYLLADNKGFVCTALSIDPLSRCCPEAGKRFSCRGCNLLSQCCNSYEFCVSCCLSPSRTAEELALKVKIAKPVTSGTYANVFDFCAGRCRHNSASVVHENAYASDFHHCFSLPLNYSAGVTEVHSEARLAGINIVVGNQGEHCDSVCKSKGQSCVPNKLLVLNKCELLQKHMNCKGGCFSSMGADQPAEVVDDAPKHLNPGACLFTRLDSMLSCDGSHQHTRRLCPCA